MLGRWRPFGTLLLKPGRLVGSTCDLPAGGGGGRASALARACARRAAWGHKERGRHSIASSKSLLLIREVALRFDLSERFKFDRQVASAFAIFGRLRHA